MDEYAQTALRGLLANPQSMRGAGPRPEELVRQAVNYAELLHAEMTRRGYRSNSQPVEI